MRAPAPFLLLAVLLPLPARAQLSLRQSEVVNGAYATIGNLLIDCPGAGTCDNNDAIMAPVDVDSDPSTAMSSAATLALPSGAEIRTATLYVSSSGTIDVAGTIGAAWAPIDRVDYPVKLGVAGGAYTTLLPADVQSNASGEGYLARYEVTPWVTASGEYFVADALLAPASHPYNRVLSWVLFVTYEDGSPPFLVNLYDGLLTCFNGSSAQTLGGFRTPAAVRPSALFSAWSVDGNPTLAGESIRVGANLISNAQNPSTNIGNSSVTNPSGPISRTPSTFRVSEEMDLDTFDVSSAFTTSQTSVDLAFSCGSQDGVIYQLMALGVQVVAPVLQLQKTVVDLNGGDAVGGDELEYSLRAENNGGDDATEVVLRDPLPPGLSFVPGSIQYDGQKTDQAGDDQAEWTGSELVFRIGAGANATTGGTLAVGLFEVVRFRATVATTTAARTLINRATLSAIGAQGGSGTTPVSRSSTIAVSTLPCSGFSGGQCPDAGFVEDAAINADAGIAVDAASAEPDASLEPDSGENSDAIPADLGRPDQGVADSGAAPPDAGTALDAGMNVDPAGCGCSNARLRGGDGLIAGIGLVLWALMRRRRG